ncbi:nuclease-related domain-containing protein [Spirulina subsalsa]|uniref:nuclease-related domain-containing protein n=1 Tax=Spirulina subsalsa TaxID=54311 RepID=UPI0002DFB58E|nr:nuclease-related domain-containing protein [Spirulina subsalsa]
MIIKSKDPIDAQIQQLEKIKQQTNLSPEQLKKVERELKFLRSGNQGEQNSAYFIDFYYKDNPHWLVIHDLRLEYDGLVAQIDHLLINRFLDFYVLESKNYAQGIKITEEGEFLVWFNNHYNAIESPIEQNARHIKVLEKLLRGEDLLPKRLGFSLPPNFLSYILVSPKSRVIRPDSTVFNTESVMKADVFHRRVQQDIEQENPVAALGSLAKFLTKDMIEELAHTLVNYHKPFVINYYQKFGISEKKERPIPKVIPSKPKPLVKPQVKAKVKPEVKPKVELHKTMPDHLVQSSYYCYNCKATISEKVATFCFNNKDRFGGKAYCYTCQRKPPFSKS